LVALYDPNSRNVFWGPVGNDAEASLPIPTRLIDFLESAWHALQIIGTQATQRTPTREHQDSLLLRESWQPDDIMIGFEKWDASHPHMGGFLSR
jgi:hypothetical protein